MTEGYCVRCRERVEIGEEEEFTMRNGKKAVRGKCPNCGTALATILPAKKPDYW